MKWARDKAFAAHVAKVSICLVSSLSGCSEKQLDAQAGAEATNNPVASSGNQGAAIAPGNTDPAMSSGSAGSTTDGAGTVQPVPDPSDTVGQPDETTPALPSSGPTTADTSSTSEETDVEGGTSAGETDELPPMDDAGGVPTDTTTESDDPPAGPGDCINNREDGDEEGVDCGGSCEPCTDYDIGPPQPDNEDRSGCEANGNGFMCAQSMVYSPSMKQAAGDDWGTEDPPFVYGVVGHDPDSGGVDGEGASYNSACCQCYQLVFKAPMDSAVNIPVPKPMIVQAFNTYAGGPSAFDIYMAAGGHGNFNGCTENGTQYSSYPDLGGDWTGGVRATRYAQCADAEGAYSAQSVASETCQEYIAGECSEIEAEEPTQSISRQSCEQANRADTLYHMNWYVAVKRVECPESLTKVTGCRLSDQGLPQADPSITSFDAAVAAGFGERSSNATGEQDPLYHTTTMQDCCRPTCAWDANTRNTADGYNRFYTCDQSGAPR